MSTGTINGLGAVTSLKNDPRAAVPLPAEPAQRRFATPTPVEIDEVTMQPLPPRFPWLSRLALQLEAASKQRSAFAAAPVIGDNLDKIA